MRILTVPSLRCRKFRCNFFCNKWTPPEFLEKKLQQSIFMTDLFDILCPNFSCSQTILRELLAEYMELYIHRGCLILLYSAQPLHENFFCLRSLDIVQKILNKDEHFIFIAGLCQSRDILLI